MERRKQRSESESKTDYDGEQKREQQQKKNGKFICCMELGVSVCCVDIFIFIIIFACRTRFDSIGRHVDVRCIPIIFYIYMN